MAASETATSSISDMKVGTRMWTTPVNPTCGIGEGVVDRRRDDGSDVRGHAPSDLLRDEDVGQQRAVRAVLFRRADRDDDGVVIAQECLDLEVGHLSQEHGWWLHRRFSS